MQQEQESAQLCVNGCGFFGNPASGGMCSVCWKKHMSTHHAETTASAGAGSTTSPATTSTTVAASASASPSAKPDQDEATVTEPPAKTEAAAPAVVKEDAKPAVPSPAETTTTTPAVATDAQAASAATESVDVKPVQKNKKRCWVCKKKVGFTGIECRCGYVFCSNHRYPDQHTCSFDFKAADRAELARRNPGGGEFGKLERL